jgi:Carboxypeptidase regulatory-like domain/TonB dependent receptor-like, beta-barrel
VTKHSSKRQLALWYLLPVFALFLVMAPAMWAQAGGGSLVGTIHDPAGAVVPNAAVVITNTDTNTTYPVTSNADGRFSYPALTLGNYKVTVTAAGFKEAVLSGITISIGVTSTIDVPLQVGETSQSVTVSANAAQIQTESSDVGTTVAPTLIAQLPLSFSGLVRSPLAFMTLTPGFAGDSSGNPQSQASFKLNGGGTGSADVLLDGASISLASPNYQWNFGISVDAITEFRVTTSTFAAEYGRTGGGFVNVASKGGTDQIHGGAYDLLKNKDFDANSWQNNHLGNAKPTDTQNDFGAYAGGPVWIPKLYDGRGKTFWFFSYEGFRYVSVGHNTASFPTQQMFNGDFSQILNSQQINGVTYPGRQIYDYTTCSGANLGNPCQPFVNNQIPLSRLEGFAQSYIPLLPVATRQNTPYQNLDYTLSAPVNNDLYSFRVDQNLWKSNKIYGSYAQADMPVADIYSYGPLFTNNFGSTKTHYVRLVETWAISPNLLNQINFGFTRRLRFENAPGAIGSWEGKLDWHGDYQDVLLPTIGVQYDPTTNGNMISPPSSNGKFVDNNYEFDEALSWSHKNHNFKFGLGHRRQEFNVFYGSNASAGFSFTNAMTSAGNNASGQAIDPNSGVGVASFFLGAATRGTVGGPQSAGMRARYWGMYAQDDWKVNPKLTMNLGLRYEIPEPVVESHCRTSQVNFTLANPGADGLPGAMEFQGVGTGRDGRCSPMNQYWGSWNPRLGATYEMFPGTVFRAGYGIYYTPLKVSNFANTDSAGFFAPGYTWAANPNQQTPAVIPSEVPAYPGVAPPIISPTALNGLNGGGGAATGGPVMLNTRLARPGTVQNWTFDVQQQLPGQWVLDMAYVGNHGSHLQSLLKDPNVAPLSALSYGSCLSVQITKQSTAPECAGKTPVAIPYGAFLSDFGSSATVAQALRPFPQYQTEDLDTSFSANPWGNFTYNAAQIQINKRFGSGLSVLSNYTWSKNITDSDSDYAPQSAWNGGSSAGVLNPFNPKASRAISQFDQTHNAKIAFTYELPVGKNRKYLANSSKLVDLAVGGWKLGGTVGYSSGFPLGATETNWTSGIFAGSATGATVVPNLVPNTNLSGFHGGTYVFGQSTKLNPAAFSQAPNYTFGNAPRLFSSARYFAQKNENVQVGKAFPLIAERVIMNIRFDAFNLFNRHSWGCLNNVVGTPGFGEFTCATGPNAETNNNISTANPAARTLQGNFSITF